MNLRMAYAIAYAVEKKLQEPVAVRTDKQTIEWATDEQSITVLRNTDLEAQKTALGVLASLRKHEPKQKRRMNEDE